MATDKSLIDRFHETSTIEEVPIADLRIDRSYQREPSQGLVDDIANDWDLIASELILVSDRGPRFESDPIDGGRFIINGQHRTLAATKLGHETIWSRVVYLADFPDPAAIEAGLRLKLNVKLGDRPLERFKAQVRAGEQDSLAIVDLLARFDTQINMVPNADEGVNCVSTIEAIFAQDQGGLLSEAMEVIRDYHGAFNGKAVSAANFKGIAWFILAHADEADRGRLVDKMRVNGTGLIHRKAITMQSTMGGALWMNYYRTVVELYNEQLRDKHRLEWKLRGAGGRFARGGGTSTAGRSGEGGWTA